jgi:N6-L-threonylcarbamoyladenine synthase
MHILGIETSCDETSAAIIEGQNGKVILKSNITATSLDLHAKTGGIIPENAAREQIKYILPVIKQALHEAFGSKTRDTRGTHDTLDTLKYIDAIALTYGPGLIGSLLVGVETAKTISFVHNIPIIPINHMIGHIYANWLIANGKEQITKSSAISHKPSANIEFPAIALVVSGGHTDILLLKSHGDYQLLGGTRDDAAGEAFDKIGRLLGHPYPAGPAIEESAKKGDPKRFRFPRPLIGSGDLEFSFSGLKTAVLRETQNLKTLDIQTINDLSYATQDAIIDVLVKKTLKAAEKYSAKSILLSGGVAANQSLRNRFEADIKLRHIDAVLFCPDRILCTDNAAMIASAGYFIHNPVSWDKVIANPELYF